ncbi:hypothetical protein [Antribacter gilvus]|uniref:hypothetical protein n=1 Tax=Antribacter gilvus TaxID=2304675 RepID=UPI000F786416|nr:hypothetical protein [Antribacter gilvus]
MRQTSLALSAVLLLSACAQGAAPAAREPTATASPAATPSDSPSPSFPDPTGHVPAPTGIVNEDTGQTQEPYAVPSWDSASQTSAVDAAVEALRAFARPDADPTMWWAELEPHLTDQAAHDYAYVDPAAIPARGVTGAGQIVDDASAYVAVVEVPTDVGPYRVTVSRQDAADQWRVDRLTPPEGQG